MRWIACGEWPNVRRKVCLILSCLRSPYLGNHLNGVASAIEHVRIHERPQKYFPNTFSYPMDTTARSLC